MKRRSLFSALLLGIGLTGAAASAAAYPDRPITLIVPFAPGGGADATGRAIALYLERRLKTPVVIVNRGGAGGQIGFTAIAKAKPDGYTIGIITAPNVVVYPQQRATPYEFSDFALIANLVQDPGLFLVRKDSRFGSIGDLIAYAKSRPGEVMVGTTGEGGQPHLAVLALEQKAGIRLTAVHYAGTAPMRMAILAGNLDMAFVASVDAAADLQAGTARALAVAATERIPAMPQTPTLTELGYEVVSIASRGLAAPAGTPKEILALLRSVTLEAAKDPEFLDRSNGPGMPPLNFMAHEAFARDLARQQQEYGAIWRENAAKTK